MSALSDQNKPAVEREFIVEVHLVVKAKSGDAAEGRVTNHLRSFARDTHATNAYVADVRGEDE